MPTSTEKVENKMHTDIGALNKLISLPVRPLSVKWELNESKETGTGILRALLQFKKEDKINILKQSDSFDKKINDTVTSDIYERLLQDEAKAGIEVTLQDNTYTLIGIYAFKPNIFTQTEFSPYVNGSITPLSGGYILVSLYSM